MKIITCFLLFLGITISTPVFGQIGSFGVNVDSSDIEIVQNPKSPEPFSTVSLRLLSNTVDLNRYPITWSVNGELKNSGVGERDQRVTIGGYGSTTTVSVTVSLGLNSVQKQLVISPQDSTLLWEAIDSYVPPFYKGKKMPGRESYIRVVGIPHFQQVSGISNQNAVFLWERNGNRILNTGGYKKGSIIIEQNKLRTNELIKAIISSQDNRFTSEKTIIIPTINPEINWYVKNSQGYRRLISINNGVNIAQESSIIVAEPYFFSLNTINDLVFNWKIGGEMFYLDTDAPENEILVSHPNETGRANFFVEVENPITFLQNTSGALTAFFKKINE